MAPTANDWTSASLDGPTLRHASLGNGLRHRKRATARNISDGLTKNITGKLFYNFRARLLGYSVPFPDL